MEQQDQYYIWLGHFVEDLSYKNLPEQRWTCSCSSCTISYQSAITIWQRTNYSTQLLLISCQHYTALWIEMKRAAGFWRSFYVMSDVLIGELDGLDLTLVASTSQSYNLPDAMTLRYSRWWSLNFKIWTRDGWLENQWHRRAFPPYGGWNGERVLSWHDDPKFFFGNTCTVIWTGYIKLVHSGLISFPICSCQTTPFLTSFTLCFVTWVAGFNKTMDVTKGEHDLPRRIFNLWYWVHRVWPRIIDNVVLMKIPSLDVIKFAHFWYSLEEENIDNIWWL